MEVFSCSERKASYLMKELDTKSSIGLIEKKRQGSGKPKLIYVKNFVSNVTESSPDDNMEFDYLMDKLSIGERYYLEEILELMLEAICVQCDTVRIGSKDIPYQLVKGRLLKINAMHIEYIIDCLGKTTNKIRNIKGYLLAMLYNASTTISSYYRAEVNYDMQNGLTTKDEYAV